MFLVRKRLSLERIKNRNALSFIMSLQSDAKRSRLSAVLVFIARPVRTEAD